MNTERASRRRLRRALRRSITVLLLTPLVSLAIGGIAMTAPKWDADILTATRVGYVVTISGTADSPAGENSGNYLQIDWGDGSAVLTLPNFTGSGPWAWGPQSHTYAAVGAYTITARLLHASQNGNDASRASDTVDVTIPPGGGDPDEVDVQVALGECVSDGETSTTPVNVTFTGEGSATVEVSDGDGVVATFTSSGSDDLAPGSYSYTVTADEGSELSETSDTADDLTVTDCTDTGDSDATVAVAQGQCDSVDGESLTPTNVSISPAGSASVVLTDGGDFVEAFTGSGGSVDLPAGDYVWTATASDGFALVGDSAGDVTAGDCPSIVLGDPPLTPGGDGGGDEQVNLPRQLAKTGMGAPAIIAMALLMAVAGAWVNQASRREGTATR